MTFSFAAADRPCRQDARARRRLHRRLGNRLQQATATSARACIAERRTLEQIENGAPATPFLKFGDRVRIEMLDSDGRSIFGAIDQEVVRYEE